ncbi:hypothetical protein [Aurantibacter sp.]|uniref:hypothetical protein n=1 Tax=Aurantibacter sp. TaxID=2807103 RepID=UPI0035C8365A
MIEEKQERLDYLEDKLHKAQFVSNFILNHKISILYTALSMAMVIPTIIHLSDKRRIHFPEKYDPMFAINLGLQLFIGFIVLAFLVHFMFKIEYYVRTKTLKNEITKLDAEIYDYKRDFERFEKFDEIGDDETH